MTAAIFNMTKGEQTRQTIIDRAVDLAHRVGLEQVTLGRLATELGLSKSGLFAHFNSKEALQLDVIAEIVRRFTEQVVAAALRGPRGLQRLDGLFDLYLRWVQGRSPADNTGCILVALTYEYDDQPGPVRDALLAAQRDWLDCIARVAKTAIDAKELHPSTDPRQLAFEFEGIALSYQMSFKIAQAKSAENMARRAYSELIKRCGGR